MKRFVRGAVWSVLMIVPPLQAAEISLSESQLEALAIETAMVEPAEEAGGHAYPAEVRVPPANQTVLAAPVDGLIERVYVAEGQAVAAGDSAVSLRSPGLVDLQRDYLKTLSEHRLAAQALERDRALAKEGIIAERRLNETRGAYEQSRAQLSALRQSLVLAGMGEEAIDTLASSQRIDAALDLVAPQAGTVMDLMAAAGERVQAASGLARISALDSLWLEVRLPVERLADVSVGSAVRVVDTDRSAEVILIGSQVATDDQTVMVRAQIDGVAGQLRPGQFLRVRLAESDAANLFRVPSAAVVREGDGFFVFRVADGGFDPVPVERLGQSGDVLTVRSPELSADDRVAVAGVVAIKGAWQGMGGGE
ncbi:efflux RND transporter periplasmic adaptor subunit [Guyparkeria hydrothermalis]|uniref:efflux RND transporter periplasmic adaptor subunit n=1 Tax=Guyparkeria hydrothermalis TaxID=923 RepID=UPI0020214A67|nr:efflux RND transporter periplasmic adaptor subunit [Guyparkeria hydrothermalis]